MIRPVVAAVAFLASGIAAGAEPSFASRDAVLADMQRLERDIALAAEVAVGRRSGASGRDHFAGRAQQCRAAQQRLVQLAAGDVRGAAREWQVCQSARDEAFRQGLLVR